MKVYAHYHSYIEPIKVSYRWRTLLQFGNSWQVVGTVFMKNPGSAKPLNCAIPHDVQEHLNCIDASMPWWNFSADSTMRCIESLFHQYYGYMGQSLYGVVQVFNLMNLRDPNLYEALRKSQSISYKYLMTTDSDIIAMRPPIYLGWGSLGSSKQFVDFAVRIFNAVIANYPHGYLREKFFDNPFYHPQYLILYGKNRPRCQRVLEAFFQDAVTIGNKSSKLLPPQPI